VINMSKKQQIKEIVLFKTCTSCLIEKPYQEFRNQSNTKDGLTSYCQKCIQDKRKVKYAQDQNYKEKCVKQVKAWQSKNRPHMKSQQKQYSQNNPWARLSGSLTKRLKRKTGLISKVQLKPAEFKAYIESLWLPDMTWENYGKLWEVVRIKAIIEFDLHNPAEVVKINHYTNLTPDYKANRFEKQRKNKTNSRLLKLPKII